MAQHEKVAEAYGCVSLDLTREVTERINAKEFTWGGDFRDLHPAPYGQRVYANSMMRMLDAAWKMPLSAKPHPLPVTLDEQSYFHGRFGPLEKAKLNKGFTLVPSWTPTIGRETRGGYVHVPALAATTPGSEFQFEFNGTAAGLMIGAGPNTGIIEASVDGGTPRKIDTFTQWSRSLYLPWAVILDDGLKAGHHTVVVRLTAEHNPKSVGTALYVLRNYC